MTAPTIIAHRGFAGQFPENTVAAAQGAVAAGADLIEVDVMPTADGDVVVFHDDRLDSSGASRGITDGTGVVWDRPTDAVTEARVLGTDECVPRLASILDAIPADVGINVELKNPGSEAIVPCERLSNGELQAALDRWTAFVSDVLAIVDEYPHEILFSSFCEGALAALRTLGTDESAVVIVGWEDWQAGASMAREYGVDAVHVPLAQVANDDIAAVARDLDAAVNVWTVRDWQEGRDALEADADGIIADYSGLSSCVSD